MIVPEESATSLAKTKGIGVVNVRAWVLKSHGPEAWERVLSSGFSEQERQLMEHVLAVEWFPLHLYARLFRALDAALGDGDLSIVKAVSKYQAERDLNTVYRMILRFKSPAYIIEKTGELWRRYHDTGTFTVRRDGPCQATGFLESWDASDVVLCQYNVGGYIHRALELVGASDVQVAHSRCRHRKDRWCEYAAKWR